MIKCLNASKTLQENGDTLLEFKTTWRMLAGVRALDYIYVVLDLMTLNLSVQVP